MKKIILFPLGLLAMACLQANATPTPPSAVTAVGTDYTSFSADSYIKLDDGIEDTMSMADMLMCIINASGASLLPGTGDPIVAETYTALVDFNLCGAGDSGGSGSSSVSSMTVESYRPNNQSPHQIKAWLHPQGVGDVNMQGSVTSAPTATNQLGVWVFDWNFQQGRTDQGRMKASANTDGFGEFEMAYRSQQDSSTTLYLTTAKSQMVSATTGIARVKDQKEATDVTLVFNETLITIKNGATTTCQSLVDVDERVYHYNLYDSTGSFVDIQSQLRFQTVGGYTGFVGDYEDSNYNTAYWVWIDGGDYPTSNGATVVTGKDGGQYTLTWDVSGEAPSVTAVADGISDSGIAHVFDKPIIFNVSSTHINTTISPLLARNGTDAITDAHFSGQLAYNGGGRLWGIDSTDVVVDGEVVETYVPVIQFADGTALTTTATADHPSKTYYVKATEIEEIPVTATGCSAVLGSLLDSAASLTLPTAADIDNNLVILATEPDVEGDPKVIHGVLSNP